jgi:hypothetical protein
MILSTIGNTYLLALAARGDLESQRQLCQHFQAIARDCPAEYFADAFAAAELFARIAAAHGEGGDIKVLAGILLKRSEWSQAGEASQYASVAEAIALLNPLRVDGDADAISALEAIAQLDGSAELFGLAAQMILTENPGLEVVAGAC